MKMMENNNKKFIKTLSVNCLKADRVRNRIAVLAIILTAVLFMALTTVLQGAQISMEEQMLRQAGTKFMVSIKNLTKEEAYKLLSNSRFAVSGVERFAANAVNPELNNMQAIVGWMDETAAKYHFIELEQGKYPEKENELACDTEVLRLFGLPEKTGSKFMLKYNVGNYTLEKEMTICGFWEGMKYEQDATLLVSQDFVEHALENYDGIYENLAKTSYDVRGSFPKDDHIKENLDELVREMGYNPDAKRGEEGFLIHHVNPVYEIRSMDSVQAYIYGGIGVLLILFAGYLIIYNIFKISVEKDIRLYGQLKTIGTSPRQIRYMVTRQGMVLSLVGIPTGLLLGWLLGNLLLPPVMANTNFGEVVFIVPSLWVWIISGLFTLVTVKISCNRPGKLAGRISPVEALKYHGPQMGRKKQKKGGVSCHRILSMAISNLSRNKGKTVLVVLSVSLSSILLNSVLNYTESMDKETYVRRDAVTDFDVRNSNYFKLSGQDTNTITVQAKTAEELEHTQGVKDFASSYCYMLPEEKVTEEREDLGKVLSVNGKKTSSDINEYDRCRMIYGYSENAFHIVKIIEGSIDYEKLCRENYVVMSGFLSDRGEYNYEAQEFHAGDVIEVEIAGEKQEYTVMAVVGAPNALNMSYSSGGYEAVVFPEPVFLNKFPEMENPIHCLFNAEEGKFDEVNAFVENLAEQRGLSCLTRLTEEASFQEMKNTYSMVGVIVSLLLGFIGILNLINVILTGVIARQREFASMRSIGMTKMQLKKLVVYEGIIYALFSGVIGILVSALLSFTVVKNLSVNTWYMKYHFTVVPAVIVFFIGILLSACISAGTDKIWNKGSIVEQLREAE